MGAQDTEQRPIEDLDAATTSQAVPAQDAKTEKSAHPDKGWWKQNHEYVRTLAAVVAALAACVAIYFSYWAMVGAQRAWVLFDNEAKNQASLMGESLTVSVKNFGLSPAVNVISYHTTEFGGFVFGGSLTVIDRGQARLLPPGRSLEIKAPWTRRDGETSHPVLITVEYIDEFGHHTTRFCVEPREDGVVIECKKGWMAD